MKSITKTNVVLPLAVIFLALGTSALTAADKQVRFKGWVLGQETDQPQGGIPPQQILVDGRLTGVATHIGRLRMNYMVTVNLNPQAGAIGSATGSARLTAANGDIIFTTITGQGVPLEDMPDVSRIVEMHTVTGGTGQFAGVTGSFSVKRWVDLGTQPASTAGSIRDGMILLPREAR